MKIALIKTHESAKHVRLNAVQYPLNIAYLASMCIERGMQTELWDFCVSPCSKEYVQQRYSQFKPDVVGISCVTPAINNGAQIAAWLKEIDEHVYTIIGGVHVSSLPLETMKDYPIFDIGVIAEGEEVLIHILEHLDTRKTPLRIPGTVYRDDGQIKLEPIQHYPDVNAIPYPARDLVDHQLYANHHAVRGISRKFFNVMEIDSSRGCPFRCSFCNVEKTHGRVVRFRDPDNVLREIEQCVRKYQANFVIFNDSTFTLRKDRIQELVPQLPKIGIEGYSVCAHVKTVDYELLKLLKDTGCRQISFGVESGSERVLDVINKKTTVREIKKAFADCRRAGIPHIEGTFILGADIAETYADMLETARLMRQLPLDTVGLGIITPFPGTTQYEDMQKLGYLEGVSWDRFQIFSETPPPWRIKNFSAEELLALRNKFLKSFYWNPKYIFNRISKIRSLEELSYYMGMAKEFYKIVVRQ